MHDVKVVRMPWPRCGCAFGVDFGAVSVPGQDMHAGHIRQTEIAYHTLARLHSFFFDCSHCDMCHLLAPSNGMLGSPISSRPLNASGCPWLIGMVGIRALQNFLDWWDRYDNIEQDDFD